MTLGIAGYLATSYTLPATWLDNRRPNELIDPDVECSIYWLFEGAVIWSDLQ